MVDNSRGTTLLEILALEIQMYTEQRNNVRLREIYDQTLHVKSAIPHPRIMGVIRECGGKMHMSERGYFYFMAACIAHIFYIRRLQANGPKRRSISSRHFATTMKRARLSVPKSSNISS